MRKTKLRSIREREGLSRATLARLADLSEKTLQRAEAGEPISEVTRNRILKALNALPNGLSTYVMKNVFPTPASGRKAKK